MEISSTVFSEILSPLAIFYRQPPAPPSFSIQEEQEEREKKKEKEEEEKEDEGRIPPTPSEEEEENESWADSSQLNPKNRIDSLAPLPNPTWRLDGADAGDASRFFAVPIFAIDKPPLRIDVHLPPLEEYPRRLREVLEPETVLWTGNRSSRSRRRITSELPVARHLARALQAWSDGIPDFERRYMSLPFGSRILVTKVSASLARAETETETEIHLYPDYEVEQAMISVEALQGMWKLPEASWPPVLELGELRFKRQVHEAITLVGVAGGDTTTGAGEGAGEEEQVMVFKSLLRDQRYMYNELKMLLTLRPHGNLAPRPRYVVVKKARFGGRRGVCGFVMEYFPLGSLKDRLLSLPPAGGPGGGRLMMMPMEERYRLARQVTEVLIHVNDHDNGFYPDLKPDNIVLRERRRGENHGSGAGTAVDAVLLDLEQRGGWFSWSPPEIAYVEYLEILAAHAPGFDGEVMERKERALGLLREYIPGWKATGQQARYFNSEGGFSAAWLALLKERQEKGGKTLERAQVFMLGKLLWCIFEGEARVRCGIDHEVLQENDAVGKRRFPDFVHSPAGIRGLIKRCTAGAPQWNADNKTGVGGAGIVLARGRLYPATSRTGTGRAGAAEEAANAAKEFWLNETQQAEAFLDEVLGRPSARNGPSVFGSARSRPLLAEVLAELGRMEKEC